MLTPPCCSTWRSVGPRRVGIVPNHECLVTKNVTVHRYRPPMAWEEWLAVAGDAGSAVGGFALAGAVWQWQVYRRDRKVAALRAVRETLLDSASSGSEDKAQRVEELTRIMRRADTTARIYHRDVSGENLRAFQDLVSMGLRWHELGVRGSRAGWMKPLEEYLPKMVAYLSKAEGRKNIKRPEMPAWFIDRTTRTLS